MDELRSSIAAAAVASGIVEAPEAETDPTAAEPVAQVAPEGDDSPETEDLDAPDLLAFEGDDAAPDADDDESETETEPDFDYKAEYERLQAEHAENQRHVAEWQAQQRAQADELNRQQWLAAEQKVHNDFAARMAQFNQNQVQDERLIAASDDPNATRAYLRSVREGEWNGIWQTYYAEKARFDQAKNAAYQRAFEAMNQRGFAELQAKTYRLPAAAVDTLMFYPDGTPVDPNAYPARAAELAEYRKTLANARRAKTQAERSAKAAEVRGSKPSPGSGQAVPAGFDNLSWRDQLAVVAGQSGLGPNRQR